MARPCSYCINDQSFDYQFSYACLLIQPYFKHNNYTKMINRLVEKDSRLVLLVSLLLFLALGWFLMVVLVIIAILRAYKDTNKIKNMERVRTQIQSLNCKEMHAVLKDSLEFVKWTKMIEAGYDSHTNTNIILQEEKEQQKGFKLTHNESQLEKDVLDVCQHIFKLLYLKKTIIQQESLAQAETVKSQKIDKFRCLFALRRKMDGAFEELHQFSSVFQARMCESSLQVTKKEKFVDECRSQILPVIESLSSSAKQLKERLQNEVDGLITDPSIQTYIDCFTSHHQQQAILDQLLHKIRQIEDKMQIKPQVDFQQDCYDQRIEDKVEESLVGEQKQIEIVHDRRQFMKRLDRLLMIGLARKKQEQFQQKMSLLQQQQQQNALST